MKLQRETKRIIVVIVYLWIFSMIGWGMYLLLRVTPTCSDGKQNQNESGIDCGGVCQACFEAPKVSDITITEKDFLFSSLNKYDVVIKVNNPNDRYGSKRFSYTISLKDGMGNVVGKKTGTSFILPSEDKYLIETNIETSSNPTEIAVTIDNQQWDEFYGYVEPQLSIKNEEYSPLSDGVNFYEAKGLLRNESQFDFNFIKINVILRDLNGNPIAVNSTNINTMNAGDQRDFRLVWPVPFTGDVKGVKMEAEADVFDSQNFIKRYIDTKPSK